MKVILTAVAALLLSSGAYAAEAEVGSKVEYVVTSEQDGLTASLGMSYVVLARDIVTDKYTVEITLADAAGNSQVQEVEADGANINYGATVFANCAAYGGTIETVTVPMGDVETCHIQQVDILEDYIGDFWVADVIFGIVKAIEVEAGETFTTELKALN